MHSWRLLQASERCLANCAALYLKKKKTGSFAATAVRTAFLGAAVWPCRIGSRDGDGIAENWPLSRLFPYAD